MWSMDEGFQALKDHENEKALEIFINLMQAYPTDPLIYEGLARSYFRLKRHEEAKLFAEKAIELDPTNPKPYLDLAAILDQMGGDLSSLLPYIETAYKLQPKSDETLKAMGWSYLKREEHHIAVDYLEKAAVYKPEDIDIQRNLFICYSHLHREEEVFKAAITVFKLRPSISSGFWLVAAFMERKRIRIARVLLSLTGLLGAFIFRAPILLILPALIFLYLLITDIVALHKGLGRLGVLRIITNSIFLIFLVIYARWLGQ